MQDQSDNGTPQQLRIVNPCGPTEPIAEALCDIAWPTRLEGLRLGFLGNGKSNVAGFLAALSSLLSGEGAETTCTLHKEGPMADCGEHRYRQFQENCDVVIVGVCDGGTAASTGAVDAATLASRGTPAVIVCTDAFAPLARMTLPSDLPGVRMVVVPHPLSSLSSDQTEALAAGAYGDVVAAIVAGGGGLPSQMDGTSSSALEHIDDDVVVLGPMTDEADGSRMMFDLGFTDGLPALLPTLDRVDALLKEWPTEKRPSHTTVLQPRRGRATPAAMAANAVMTGLPPALMPYLSATLDAAAHPAFKLFNLQTTTNPVTPVIVVGGPNARSMGFNDGAGSIGGGAIANATLGRALKLCMRNMGGGRAADGTDPATMGQPGKYAFCFAENEEITSWPRLRTQTRQTPLSSIDDTVTLVGVTGTMNMIIKSTSAEELLQMIAKSIRSIGSNDYMFGGTPLLVLCPEHAETLERDSVSLSAIQETLFDLTKITFSEFAPKNQEMMRTPRSGDLGTLSPETEIPLVKTPADLLVCVTGGSSLHSTFMPSFGGSEPVSARVAL